MDARILTVDLNIAAATLNLRRAGSITPGGIREEATVPGEFSVLKDCVCRDGLIWPRPRLVAVEGVMEDPSPISLGEFRNGASGDDWLVGSLLDFQYRAIVPIAMLMSQDGNRVSVAVRKIGNVTNLGCVPFAFWSYRNQCWASNGLYGQMFDGRGWSDQNNGRTAIAARLGGTAERKMFMANTPTYPDEYIYADANKEVSVMSKWPGMEAAGGTGVGVSLYGLVAPTGHGIWATGGAGIILRTATGAAWYTLPPPTIFTLQSILLTPMSSGKLPGYVVGMSTDTAPTAYWTDNAIDDPVTWRAIDMAQNATIDIYDVLLGYGHTGELETDYEFAGQLHQGAGVYACYTWRSGNVWHTEPLADSGSSARSAARLSMRRIVCGNRSGADAKCTVKTCVNFGTWVDMIPTGVTETDFNSVAAYMNGTNYIVLVGGTNGTNGKTYRYLSSTPPDTAPAAGTWSEVALPGSVTTKAVMNITTLTKDIAYACGEGGMVIKGTNMTGGAAWTAQDSGVSVRLNRIINYDSDPLHLMAVGDGGVCITTVDGGTTWITPGVGEQNPDKMVNSDRFGAGESIRAKYQRSGQIAFFTNRGIRVLDEGTMKQQFALDGFETFNDNCIGEWRGMIVMLGKMNGEPGIYGWDGSASPPRLLSESTTGMFRSSPGNNYVPCLRCIPDTSDHIWDTEDDFRPRLTPGNPGWAFNESLWAYDNGIMVMRSQPTGASPTEITMCGVSKVAAEPDEKDSDGVYVPRVTDWGFISFDYQLYHPADESKVGIQVQVQTAPDVLLNGMHTPGTWTGWGPTNDLSWFLDKTEQKGNFGRCTIRLSPLNYLGQSLVNPANPWLQFKLLCKNLAQNDSDVCINRVILRAVVDGDPSECPAPPCLVVHNDTVQAHFSLDTVTETPRYQPRCVVLSGKDMQASTIDTGNEIAAARVLNDVLYMGMYYHGSGESVKLPRLLAAVDDNGTSAIDYIGLSQEIRFVLDFAGPDAVARTLPKDLRKLYLSARPAPYAGSATVLVKHKSNDADDPTEDWDSDSLEFAAMHRPDAVPALVRHHVLDLEAAYTSQNSTGRRFHFIIEPGTDTSAPFIIEAAKIEAMARGEDWPTSYGGTVGGDA